MKFKRDRKRLSSFEIEQDICGDVTVSRENEIILVLDSQEPRVNSDHLLFFPENRVKVVDIVKSCPSQYDITVYINSIH